MPWALGKDETKKARLAAVMYTLCESLRIVSILLEPFMPSTTPRIQAQLGLTAENATYDSASQWGRLPADAVIQKGETLFPRIDVDKEIEALNALIPNPMEQKAEKKGKAVEGVAMISIDDFAKVELKVAKVTACEPIKRAKKLLKLTLDDGSGTPRTVASGIAKWYKPEDLIGHSVVVVSNLKPAVLCGVESQGMILAADAGEDDVKVLFADGVPAGSKVR